MVEFEQQWDEIMAESRQDDLKSKITALDSLLGLMDRNDVKSAGDVKEIINSYREVLSDQVKGEE